MSDLETIFAKLAGLIEAGERANQDGTFEVEIPASEWDIAEASLDRTPADRKFMARVFRWRTVYVVRGSRWFINPIAGAMIHEIAPPIRRGAKFIMVTTEEEPPTPVASA